MIRISKNDDEILICGYEFGIGLKRGTAIELVNKLGLMLDGKLFSANIFSLGIVTNSNDMWWSLDGIPWFTIPNNNIDEVILVINKLLVSLNKADSVTCHT